jgi:hypothetical protein
MIEHRNGNTFMNWNDLCTINLFLINFTRMFLSGFNEYKILTLENDKLRNE